MTKQLRAKHIDLVREGKFGVAKLVLRFMRYGHICLGLNDDSSACEKILEDIGYKPRYSGTYDTAEFSINRLWPVGVN